MWLHELSAQVEVCLIVSIFGSFSVLNIRTDSDQSCEQIVGSGPH